MEKTFEKFGIKINEEQLKKFNIFKETLLKYNAMFNLTSIKDEEGINIKHFADSAMGVNFFKDSAKVIEIGSGGGFPSVPLKILRPDLKMTLVESTGKKCSFLNFVKESLNFENFEVLNVRCEDLAKNNLYRETFDHVTARAVARLNTLCEYCIPFLKKGGSFIAYKSDDQEEFKESLNAINILGAQFKEKFNYSLVDVMDKRSIYVIEKINNTPLKYPRGNGKERSKPLI